MTTKTTWVSFLIFVSSLSYDLAKLIIETDEDENNDDHSVDAAPTTSKSSNTDTAIPSLPIKDNKNDGDATDQSQAPDACDDIKKEVEEDVAKTPAKRETRSSREQRVSFEQPHTTRSLLTKSSQLGCLL